MAIFLPNSTYIIGAGFSKFAGLPLMNDFFYRAKEIYTSLSDNDKNKINFEKVFDFYKKYSEVKNFMNMDLMNIEELLSIIEMNQFLNNTRMKKYYINFLRVVIEKSTKSELTSSNLSNINKYKYLNFIKHVYGFQEKDDGNGKHFIPSLPQNGIISLNYDLVLENTLINSPIDNYNFKYGINEKFINPGYDIYKNKLILAKIHGSINFIDGSSNLIVPPTWNKTSEYKIRPVWKLANDLIGKSENIIFIGYSLPKTDLYVKYLLINGIKKCENLKKIIVICLDDENNSTRKRYEEFFESYFREKSFTFISEKFEKIDWENLKHRKKFENGSNPLVDIL